MMEFATENYLSDLLINVENKGFESAKESFYECIANDRSAVEGIVREDGTTTNKNNGFNQLPLGMRIVSGILLAPVALVVAVVVVAIGIIGTILIVIGKIVKFIFSIPGMIVNMFKGDTSSQNLKNDVATLAGVYTKNLMDLEVNINHGLDVILPYLQKVSSANAKSVNAAGAEAYDKTVDTMKKITESYNTTSKSKEEFERKFDIVYGDKNIRDEERKLKVSLSRLSKNYWVGVADMAKKIGTKLQQMEPLIKKYGDSLKKTKAACDNAKANNKKDVDVTNLNVTTESANKFLKNCQVIIKASGQTILWIKEWAYSSKVHNTGLSDKDYESTKMPSEAEKSLSDTNIPSSTYQNEKKITRDVRDMGEGIERFELNKLNRKVRENEQEEIAELNKKANDALNYGKKK